MVENLRVSYSQLERDVRRSLGTLLYDVYGLELSSDELRYYYTGTSTDIAPMLNHVVYAGLVVMLTEITLKTICEDYGIGESYGQD